MEKTKKTLDFKSKGDALFLELKTSILNGLIKPGEELNQSEISNEYKISRIPVRDAIRRLESTGLIKLVNNRAIVKHLDIKSFTEVYELRNVIENYAIEKVLNEINEEELSELFKILKMMKDLVEKKDIENWVTLDRDFHLKIYESSKNLKVYEVLCNLYDATNYIRLNYCNRIPGRIKIATFEHEGLYKAIKQRNVKNCRKIIKNHIKGSIREISKPKNENIFLK